jgi:NADH-quinone oxidoreductase subunit N
VNATLLLPEIVLAAAALATLMIDLRLPPERKGLLCWFGAATCAALFGLTFLPGVEAGGKILGGSWQVDGFALLMKRAFAVTGALVLLMSRESVDELPRARGEYTALTLFALLGMFLVASVNDFLSLFVAIEVVTVSFFVLAAFRRDDPKSVEAGLKLLVIGSLSAGILLYGIAFVYGATGSIFFDDIRARLPALVAGGGAPVELLFGAILVFLGLGFKTSAVPLHVWVPDVYQGAPTPVSAFLSVGSKIAGFVLVLRVLQVFSGVHEVLPVLSGFFALVAALTLLYGNLGAIPQSDIKRLMGYSSIGQCGYLLVGIASCWSVGIDGVLFYLAAYVLMNLAAFAVILLVARATGSHEIDDLSGLARRSPLLGAALTVALLSLAGVPPFMGFFGKFLLVGSAFDRDRTIWVGVIGLVNVVIALYYYLCVVKRVYVGEPRVPTPIPVPRRMRWVLAVSIALLIAGGVAPGLLEKTTARVVAEMGFAARGRDVELRLPPR